MKITKIVILRENHLQRPYSADTLIIHIRQLGRWIRKGKIFRHLFRYKEAGVFTSDLKKMPRPFLIALSTRLLSRKTCFIQDEQGITQPITIFFLCQLFFRYLVGFIRKTFILQMKYREIPSLSNDFNRSHIPKVLDLSARPVYIRTEQFAFFKAGGNIAHTTGVLNSLHHFVGRPIFLTTVDIPTVNHDVETHTVPHDSYYLDFPEVSSLLFNDYFKIISAELLKGEKISFVYQRYDLHNYSGLQLARDYGVPFVLEYNGSEIWISRHWGTPIRYKTLGESIELFNLHGADIIVAVSKALQEELVQRGVDEAKILVNPNGVDSQRYSPEIDGDDIRDRYNLNDKIVLGFIGTFGEWHGAEILAEAFGRLMEQYPAYRNKALLLMIGNGKTLAKVKDALNKYKATDLSVLTGIIPQEEGPRYLAACDILVAPHIPNSDGTPFFGSPTKLFEYMAMGKGIIASDLDQIGEILKHEQTALLVPPADVDSLIKAMKNLIDNPSLCEQLGKSAREDVVDRFTWKDHTGRIIEKLKERIRTASIEIEKV